MAWGLESCTHYRNPFIFLGLCALVTLCELGFFWIGRDWDSGYLSQVGIASSCMLLGDARIKRPKASQGPNARQCNTLITRMDMFIRVYCGVQVSDLTGAFRLYRRDVFEKLVHQCTSKVWTIDLAYSQWTIFTIF